MKEKLVRLELMIDFSCKPKFNSYHYEDEVMPEGKVYRNQTGIRNDKTKIRLGEIWMSYEDNSNTPYWKSTVIVKESIDKEQLMETSESLFNTSKMLIKNSFETFKYRFNDMTAFNEHDTLQVFRYGSLEDAKFRMNLDDFKNEIIKNAKNIGESLSAQYDCDYNSWENYFNNNVKDEFLNNIIQRFTVLKVIGDEVEFQVKNNCDMTINAVSNKLAKDLFFMFNKK